MRFLIFLLIFLILILVIYYAIKIADREKVKEVRKSSAIIPKEGTSVSLKDGLSGVVIGYKDDKIVIEVHADINDILR